jgi:NADH-quinone oxidoreductase subunit H
MAAIAVTLFFGGWQVPFAGPAVFTAARGPDVLPGASWWLLQIASMVVFAVKTLLVLNLIVWVRWTLPRIRVDQMMALCWKFLVPFALACFTGTLFWQILLTRAPVLTAFGLRLTVGTVAGVLGTVTALVVAFFFLRLTRRNVAAAGDRIDLTNW